MFSSATFAACGPGLIAGQSAIALFFVYRRLSRVRHALAWALAFAALTVQWLLFTLADVVIERPAATVASIAAGLIGLLLFVEGFHIRATGHWPSPRRIAAGLAILVLLLASSLVRSIDWLAVVVPLTAGVLFCVAAGEVVPRGKRASISETLVVAMLLGLAVVKLVLLAMIPLGASPALRSVIGSATWTPTAAAGGLFTLLLIAYDFSVELRRLLHTDPLTEVLNRAGFEERAGAVLARARNRPVAVAVADIDLFKGVNDRFGHAAGDAALACVADQLRMLLGREDLLGRIGGEEFAILFRDSGGREAVQRIERVRSSLREVCIGDFPDVRVTVSFGVSERRNGESLAEMIERADQALYHSKRSGRDRTTFAEEAA